MLSPDSFHSPDITPSLSSVESLRSSLPESYQSLFDTLRREVMDFCDFHSIPTSSLNNDEALREATKHLSNSDLEQLSLVLKRLDYLVSHKKPLPPEQDPAFQEAMEYANEYYHLREQYTSQVSFLEQIGILKDGCIEAIDGRRYPVPTLEQIAERLYERREELGVKHGQGFTKLVLVPFGRSLSALLGIFERFLLLYKHQHPDFDLDIGTPLWTDENYPAGDVSVHQDGSSVITYEPTLFDQVNHQGKSKTQILEEQTKSSNSFPGWRVHLFQPSNPEDSTSLGIASIPLRGQGKEYGEDILRPDITTITTAEECLSILTQAKTNPDSPYHSETGLAPEDWMMTFMTHLEETGLLLDNYEPGTESVCVLTGSFFPFSHYVPGAGWSGSSFQVRMGRLSPFRRGFRTGSRFSVRI